MIKIKMLPLVWKYEYRPLASEDAAIWKRERQKAFEQAVLDAKEDINNLLASGYVVLSSHLLDTETDTTIY